LRGEHVANFTGGCEPLVGFLGHESVNDLDEFGGHGPVEVTDPYLRLVGANDEPKWDSRGHFYAAAAEAMRRILIENARRKGREKRGGDRKRVELGDPAAAIDQSQDRLMELDAALTKLAAEDSTAAEVVKLHIFAELPLDDVAKALGMSRATAYRQWKFARAWLKCEIEENT